MGYKTVAAHRAHDVVERFEQAVRDHTLKNTLILEEKIRVELVYREAKRDLHTLLGLGRPRFKRT